MLRFHQFDGHTVVTVICKETNEIIYVLYNGNTNIPRTNNEEAEDHVTSKDLFWARYCSILC